MMYKKTTYYIWSIILFLLFSSSVYAYDTKIGGIYYNLKSDGKAEVTYDSSLSYGSYRGDISIPDIITNNNVTYHVVSIGDNAFYNCCYLTSISIPNSVTYIGEWAFYDCSGLTSITIPNSVKTIKYATFYGCSGLKSITIPNSVTKIEMEAFYDCRNLTSVIIPNSVKSIGNAAFFNCDALTSITIPNGVTTIESSAFGGCSSLTSVTIPNSVASIGTGAFYDTPWDRSLPEGLIYLGSVIYKYKGSMPENTSITIKEGTKGIGGGAFSDCSGLTSVTIPNSVTKIGEWAFFGCTALTSIIIPNSVTTIGELAFAQCGLPSITIPNSVKYINESAFSSCRSLTSITIPNSITTIKYATFKDCSGLSSITIPNSVTKIERDAFEECISLKEIFSDIKTPFEISWNVFSSNTYSTAKLTIPKGTMSAYQSTNYWNMFSNIVEYGALNTYSLSITASSGGSVTYSSNTISGATQSFNVEEGTSATLTFIPNDGYRLGSVKVNGFDVMANVINNQYTISNISQNTTVSAEFVVSSKIISFADAKVKALCVANWDINGDGELSELEATVPDSDELFIFKSNATITSFDELRFFTNLTCIRESAFVGCSGLTSITIPNSVTSIGNEAFCGCCSLTSITIPNRVMSIGEYAFSSCSSLTSLTIPNSVTSIGKNAFSYCSGLTSVKVESGNTKYDSRDNCNAIIETTSNTLIVGCNNTTIPNSVTSIGESAFGGCSGLTSITIPNSVTNIGVLAFSGCTGLTSITIPNSVTSIGNSAFFRCSDLTSITIPNSVTSIGESVFGGCSGLTSITIPNSVTSIGEGAFGGCSGLTSITIPNSVTSIGESAFGGCSALTSITIPNSVTSIGNYVFRDCSDLTSVKVESGNTKYDSRDNCNAIIETTSNTLIVGCKNTTIPNNVTSIAHNAFAGCSGLTSITIPNSVTNIGVLAFFGCTGLTSITIPNSVTSIGNSAFSCCSSLTSVVMERSTPVVIGKDCFTNRTNAILHVPYGSKSAYAAAEYWKEFKEIVEYGAPTTYSLSITASSGGSVTYSGNTISGATKSFNVEEGTPATLTFTPDNGYRIGNVVVNGTDVTSDVTNNQYTINNFNQNTSVEATFEKEEIIPTYREAGIKVDLGLSVLWADRNVGANSVTATGDYFAWGDTIARFSYDSNSYIYMMTDGEYKKIGDIICGNREYDAATLQWGGEWRMPTDTELQELIDNCTWTYVLRNGVYGYEVAGRNGNAIFLPVTGYMRGQTKELSSTYSYYWSGVVSYERPVSGKAVKFAPEEQSEMTRVYRYLGLCLRPVYGPVPAYFSLSISSTGNGTVTYLDNKISGKTQSFYINEGGSATLAIAPSDGYRLKSVVVNGVDVTANVENDQYIINNVSRNTTVKVEFEAIPPIFSLVITATGNGSVTYNGTAIRSRTSTFSVEASASATLIITPDNGNRLKSVVVNGTDVTANVVNNQFTINSINQNTIVEVEFEAIPPTTYSLSITAIGNGSVSYNGTTVRGNTNTLSVVEGTSATITITPDNGYRVKSVKVNGSDVTSLVSGNQYAVSNISKNTTIEVVFEKIPQTYTLTITASGNGYVSYLEASIAFSKLTKEFTITEGSTATLTFTPNNGYRLKSVAVNGTDVTSVVANNRYAISNINKNTTVTVTFEEIPPTTYWLTITAKGNGSVKCEIDNTSSSISSSTKSISVVEGKRVKLTFTPNSGYRVVSIKVNGTVIESNLNSYSISAFNQNTTVEVEFEEIPPATYTLTISSTVGGYVAYAGNTIHETTWNYSVVKGTSVTLTFTPNNGYRLKIVVVNGTDVTANVVNNQYTINNISRNTTIEVGFEEIPPTTYTLSITAEGNGYVSYVEKSIAFNKTKKDFTVEEGADVTLAFSPMSGYRVKSVVVNGTNVTTSVSNNRYAISNINKNTSVIVSFEEIPPTTYSLTITAVGNGYASYNGTNVRGTSSVFTVVEGTSATITFVPDVGYRIKSVSVNGEDVTASITNQYTISSISRDMTIEVVFEVIPPKTYTLSITAEGNGSVSYLEASASFSKTTKEFTITEESSATLTFTPNNGYRLKGVVVNGVDVTANVVNNQYTINNISRNTTVVVTFEEIPPTIYALSITATGNGSVGYNGTTIRNKTSNLTVVEGSNVTIVVTPDDGNRIKNVIVNGIDVTARLANNQYTISNVNTDTTIKVEFFEELKRMTYADVNYKVLSYDEKTVKVEAGNYSRVLTVPSSFSYQEKTWMVIGIEEDALTGSPNLAAIIWKPNYMFTATVTNPNLLLYVDSATYASNAVKNVVVNGVANSITLAEAADGNDFYCPQSFTAKTISYTHNYMMTTGIDECQGWETLALPFDVQTISHASKGEIVPFAAKTNGGQKGFWLYRLSDGGWKWASAIKANTPYIISMPNNDLYYEHARLNGRITFSASDVTIPVTSANTATYGGRTFVPNFTRQAQNGTLYTLNVNNEWYSSAYGDEGSLFIANQRSVSPFEAYMTTTNGARTSFGIFEDMSTDMSDVVQLIDAKRVNVYNITGQKRKMGESMTLDELKQTLPAGVYIINGQKVIVR